MLFIDEDMFWQREQRISIDAVLLSPKTDSQVGWRVKAHIVVVVVVEVRRGRRREGWSMD
jgi:hypothetical protein